MKLHSLSTPAGRRAMRGFSLVELMVSLTIGLVLVGAMLTLLARNSETRGEIEKAGRQVENGRYGVQRLSEDLRHAGFYGEYSDLPAPPGALPDPCSTDLTTLKTAMSLPVQGYTAAATPPTCINTADFVAGTNVLVVRFASPAVTLGEGWVTASLATTLTNSTIYMQPNVEDVAFATGSGAAAAFTLKVSGAGGALVNAPIYRYVTRLYFISPCSRHPGTSHCTSAADDGAPVPTLKMVELTTAGAFSDPPIAVAEGVERLEFDYGLDSNADGSPDSYVTCAPCTTAQWSNVVTVRINLLARNAEASAGYSDAKTYAMGLAGAASAPSDKFKFKRHVYQVVTRLNNQSMRREQ